MDGTVVMRSILSVVVAMLILHPNAGHPQANAGAETDISNDIITSHHTIRVSDKFISYTARAGSLSLRDEATGQVHAKMFFASFTVEPRRGEPTRPLTFYTNGGPGGAATIGYVGPRVFKGGNSDGVQPPPPYELIDNEQTWLTVTDLVLIDPVGTGYSRATKPEYNSEFYNPDGDAESIAKFMQLYLKWCDPAIRQPIFLAGHSYGSIRSALVADILHRRGIPLRGLFLASSPLEKQPDGSDLSYTGLLPSFTATAFFHKKLSPDLQRNFDKALEQAESWAATDYPNLLAQGDKLVGEPLKAAAVQMARLTGLTPAAVLNNRLRFLPDAFLRELLGEQFTPPGLGDSRKLKSDEFLTRYNPDLFTVLSDLYLNKELHVKSTVSYEDSPMLGEQWSCGMRCGVNPKALMSLQRAMRDNPTLQVTTTNGYYDFVTPYFVTKRAMSRLEPQLRSRVNVIFYKGGHKSPPEFRSEMAGFIRKVLAMRGRWEVSTLRAPDSRRSPGSAAWGHFADGQSKGSNGPW